MKPGPAALPWTALARSAPSWSATYGATPGVTRSGVIVETMIWSTSSAVRPASSSASARARVASSARGGRGRAGREDAGLADAGAAHDPLVARVEPRHDLVVRDHALGQRGADAEDAGGQAAAAERRGRRGGVLVAAPRPRAP